MWEMRGGVIAPHKDLRDALYEKTLKYGALDKPYLIAVANGKDLLFSKDSIHSALTWIALVLLAHNQA